MPLRRRDQPLNESRACLDDLLNGHLDKLMHILAHSPAYSINDQRWVIMRPACGFFDEIVHNAVAVEVATASPERLGSLLLFGRVAVEDGRETLRADGAVKGILEHDDPVTEAECQRTSGTRFTYDAGHHWGLYAGYHPDALCNGKSLALVFRLWCGIGTGCVYKSDHRPFELFSELEQLDGLIMTGGACHSVVVTDII